MAILHHGRCSYIRIQRTKSKNKLTKALLEGFCVIFDKIEALNKGRNKRNIQNQEKKENGKILHINGKILHNIDTIKRYVKEKAGA